MKRRLMALCAVIMVAAVSLTVVGAKPAETVKTDISCAELPQHYNEADDMNNTKDEAADMNNTTTQGKVDNYIEDKTNAAANSGGLISGFGGFGGIVGDIGDVIGGIIGGDKGGNTQNSTPAATYPNSTNNIGYIDPVPAVTYIQGQISLPVDNSTTLTTVNNIESDTFNASLILNPYKKPAGEIKPGDSGEGVKWLQWIFMYTNYGLAGKPVNGVYDEETQTLVKKLQKENGFVEDGVVNDAVIDKIELLYYEHTLITTTTPSASLITAPSTIETTTADGDNDGSSNPLGKIIIIISAIWCIAIVVIIILLVSKKKKVKKNKTGNSDPTEGGDDSEAKPDSESETSEDNGDFDFGDIFEETDE